MSNTHQQMVQPANDPTLPPGWWAVVSQNRWPGKVYYYNENTGQCLWTHPGHAAASKKRSRPPTPDHPRGIDPSVTQRTRRDAPAPTTDVQMTEKDPACPVLGSACPNCKQPRIKSLIPIRTDVDHLLNLNRGGREDVPGSGDLAEHPPPPPADGVDFFRRQLDHSIPCFSKSSVCNCHVRTFYKRAIRRILAAPSTGVILSQMGAVQSVDGEPSPASVVGAVFGDTTTPDDAMRIENQREQCPSPNCASDKIFEAFVDEDITEEDQVASKCFELEDNAHVTIELDAYIDRIFTYGRMSETCYVASLIYLLRMMYRMALSERNIFKALLACVVMAAKFCEDAQLSNRSFATIGGVSTTELNYLERSIIHLLRWRFGISKCEFATIANRIYRLVPEGTTVMSGPSSSKAVPAASDTTMSVEPPGSASTNQGLATSRSAGPESSVQMNVTVDASKGDNTMASAMPSSGLAAALGPHPVASAMPQLPRAAAGAGAGHPHHLIPGPGAGMHRTQKIHGNPPGGMDVTSAMVPMEQSPYVVAPAGGPAGPAPVTIQSMAVPPNALPPGSQAPNPHDEKKWRWPWTKEQATELRRRGTE